MIEYFIYPGFLGQPGDFAGFAHALGRVEILDSLTVYPRASERSLTGLGPELQPPFSAGSFRVGIGYSMGGRLLMALSHQNPTWFDAMVFLSAHPGLTAPDEREARRAQDQVWAERFHNGDWEETLRLWNAQAVFQGSSGEVRRQEDDYDREGLARQLIQWSVAHQPDYRFFLRSTNKPFLWLAGDRDLKYAGLALDVMRGTRILPQAGHRLHLDQPQLLADVVREWAIKEYEKRRSPR